MKEDKSLDEDSLKKVIRALIHKRENPLAKQGEIAKKLKIKASVLSNLLKRAREEKLYSEGIILNIPTKYKKLLPIEDKKLIIQKEFPLFEEDVLI